MKHLSLPALPQMILSFCFYLALLRGTNMGLFYPTSESELGLIDYTAQTAMNLVLLASLIAYFFVKNDYSFFIKSLSRATTALVMVGLAMSLAFSGSILLSLKYMLAVSIVSLPVLLYSREFGADRMLRALARFMIVAAFANIFYIITFPQYAVMTGNHDGAWRGLFEHKNPAGAILGMSSFIIILQLQWQNQLRAFFYLAGSMLCLVFAYLSHSSTALVATVMMGLTCTMFYFLMRLGSAKERIFLILTILSIALLVYAVAGQEILSALFQAVGRDMTLTGRTQIWAAALDMVAERPLVGFGPGATDQVDFFRQIQGEVGWEVKSMHNSYIDAIVNYGYPTAFLLVIIFLTKLIKALVSIPVDRAHLMRIVISGSILVGMLVECLTESGGFLTRSIIWVMTLCGICGLSEIPPKRNQSQP